MPVNSRSAFTLKSEGIPEPGGCIPHGTGHSLVVESYDEHEALEVKELRGALAQHGPLGLNIVEFFAYRDYDDYYTGYHIWREHELEPIPGTPPAPEGQRPTFEGVNVALLREARRHQAERTRQRMWATYAAAVALGGLALGAAAGSVLLGAVAATSMAAGLLGGGVYAYHMHSRLLGGLLGWFEPTPLASMKAALETIPLTFLPGDIIRSRPLWNLGLGRRLAHVSPAAREVMVALADEAGLDLRRLAEMAEAVTGSSEATK